MQPAGPERYPEAISALEQGAANPDFWAASQAIGYSEVAEGENGRREQGNALKELQVSSSLVIVIVCVLTRCGGQREPEGEAEVHMPREGDIS